MSTSTISGSAVSTPVTTPAALTRMINAYAWLDDVKADLNITGTTYDGHLIRELDRASRMIDKLTGWQFYPKLATRYFDVESKSCHYVHNGTLYPIEPLLAITSISMSDNDGSTYTALSASDYYTSRGGNYEASPWTEITLSELGSYTYWYTGQRSVKIIGTWGYREDYAAAWESSQDAVAIAMNASQTTVTVADANGANQWGYTPRFQVGQLLRIDSEYVAVTGSNTTTNVLTVVRGCNGTTAATHSDATRIDIWRPQDLASNCTRVQAVRWFKRAQQAFQDVSAALELGQLTYAQELDPDLRSMLKADLMRLV
jgi:hypothetical protein